MNRSFATLDVTQYLYSVSPPRCHPGRGPESKNSLPAWATFGAARHLPKCLDEPLVASAGKGSFDCAWIRFANPGGPRDDSFIFKEASRTQAELRMARDGLGFDDAAVAPPRDGLQ